ISYWFYSSPNILGKYLCEGTSCNGLSITDEECSDIGSIVSLDGSEENSFAVPPYSIHAVYEDQIKCIGAHEDTHVIAAYINEPSSDFLCEGLAMFMDGTWWSKPNSFWVQGFCEDGVCPRPSSLINLSGDAFFEVETRISYPLSGAWVDFFISVYGINSFLSVYSRSSDYIKQIEKETAETIDNLDEKFFSWILLKTS
ncbi:MAG: hypothetical protein J6A16_08355, partial [Oscillospiraceae bacterium]|nr:hypothetical protein [Oscillospiraceae bacterium]